jgi:hypothetical protein
MGAAGVEPPSPAIETSLDAIHGCRQTAEQRAIWRVISPQKWPNRKMRRAAACVGRRGLKTSGIAAWDCVFESLKPVHDAYAMAGSRVYALIVAPRLAQARESQRAVRAVLDQLKSIGVDYVERDSGGSPELVLVTPWLATQRVISVQSADAIAVRGFAICYVVYDEASFLGSDDWLAQTDRDLVTAVAAGTVQFPDARELYVSSPGAPQGVFHGLIERTPPDCLVIRAPSWITNPRITREDCWRVSNQDPAVFAQEHEASRFGFHNETFIDAASIRACMDAERAGQGPRQGDFCVGLDIGQKHDASAIVVCSSYVVETHPGEGVRGVAVDHLETVEADRKAPPSLEDIVGRAVTVARKFGGAPIICDPFNGVTVEQLLQDAGWRKADDREHLRRRRYFIAPMGPAHQGPRWALARTLILSRRAAFHPTHDRLMRELAQLKATALSLGGMRVEGRRDDCADAFALACEVANHLPPSGDGRVTFECDGRVNDDRGWAIPINPRYVKTLSNGRKVRVEIPEWDRSFDDYARLQIANGFSTPAIERWKAKHPDEKFPMPFASNALLPPLQSVRNPLATARRDWVPPTDEMHDALWENASGAPPPGWVKK